MNLFAAKKETQMTAKKLAALVDEAVANEIELRRLHSLDGDLTPKAYLEACAAVPGASSKEAEAIEKQLDGGPEGALIAPSFRRMLKNIRAFRRSAPHKLLSGYMDAEGDSALARIGATRQSLFFAAARAATKQPELFGSCTAPNQFGDAIAKCKSERARLLSEIETGWTAHDVVVERDRVSFRLSNGIVTVSENLAENLVNFCVAERDQVEAA